LTLAVPARAKLNLDLEVLSRGSDGFHQIRTTMQSVALHDLLELERAEERTALKTSGLALTEDKDNSVLKAHAALERATGRELPTRFHLHKRIPPGAGLGGASSDAAAALRGLKSIHKLKVDLEDIAAGVGADVPFFLNGGTALVEGRGERLTRLSPESGWFAIAWPGIELLTSAVYRAWDEVKGDGSNQLTRAAMSVAPQLQDFARQLGDGWQMTGSGSAFFRRAADQSTARKATTNLDCWTSITHAVGAWA
jgi:4-diphosphocytidyl-2-C-methyl-D-erythritol kinase